LQKIIHDLKKEIQIGPNVRELIEALLQPTPVFYAESVYNAVSYIGTDDSSLADVGSINIVQYSILNY